MIRHGALFIWEIIIQAFMDVQGSDCDNEASKQAARSRYSEYNCLQIWETRSLICNSFSIKYLACGSHSRSNARIRLTPFKNVLLMIPM